MRVILLTEVAVLSTCTETCYTSFLTAFLQRLLSQCCPLRMPVVAQCMSGCRVCQSLMKSVPPSQVSFGRGVGEEGVGGRSSGVKDNRIRRAVYVHYTVTQHSHFLPLPFFSSLSLQTEDNVIEEQIIEMFVPSLSCWRPAKKCTNNNNQGMCESRHCLP